jgi:hypothetical protein
LGDAAEESIEYDLIPQVLSASLVGLGAGTFFFNNGFACVAEQYYCYDSQSTIGPRIDCSGVEGGSVIENCNPPSLTAELSPMELLFWLPILACSATPPPTSDGGTIGNTGALGGGAPADAASVANGTPAARAAARGVAVAFPAMMMGALVVM